MSRIERRNSALAKLALIFIVALAMLLAGCAVVRVVEPPESLTHWDVDSAIAHCYEQITGESTDNIDGINRDTHVKLEDCVNEKVQSKKRITLVYWGSENGIIIRAK